MYGIAKPINGISLNGDEFILTGTGEVKMFKTEQEAEDYANIICCPDTPESYGIHIVELPSVQTEQQRKKAGYQRRYRAKMKAKKVSLDRKSKIALSESEIACLNKDK